MTTERFVIGAMVALAVVCIAAALAGCGTVCGGFAAPSYSKITTTLDGCQRPVTRTVERYTGETAKLRAHSLGVKLDVGRLSLSDANVPKPGHADIRVWKFGGQLNALDEAQSFKAAMDAVAQIAAEAVKAVIASFAPTSAISVSPKLNLFKTLLP